MLPLLLLSHSLVHYYAAYEHSRLLDAFLVCSLRALHIIFGWAHFGFIFFIYPARQLNIFYLRAFIPIR